jgi:iron complex transport system substrate-binding protein
VRACSFLPAATSIISQLGLEDLIYGVTFECPSDRPKVVRTILEGKTFSSEEIDRFVSDSKAKGIPLYYIDEELLAQAAPDIIFTQDVCDVCQIDTSVVQRAVHKLKKQPLLVPLIPRNLDDVFDNVLTIGKALHHEQKAIHLLSRLNQRRETILNTLLRNRAPLKRVMIMEWLSPIYNCGHWIPYQVAAAGGVDMLSNPGGYSIVTEWEKIRKYNPEVLVIAPCGFHIERSATEINKLTVLEGWEDMLAVKTNRVFLADANLFTQPSAELVDGIELLAALFHPDLFDAPEQLSKKFIPLEIARASAQD